ncbi:MAG: hypothetical protein ACRDL7_12800, partial [Gaiellaceae bacterium]
LSPLRSTSHVAAGTCRARPWRLNETEETMRKALIPAFLLVLGAVVLGSTAFREQLANAMPPGPPPQNVVVANTSTNPVPVQQQGTAAVNVANVPSVHVAGTVTTTSADATTILYEGDLCGTASQFAGPIDTAGSGSIRVGVLAVTSLGSDQVTVQTYDTASYFFHIADLTIPQQGEADGVYKTPATKIALTCTGPAELHAVVYGRP